MVKYFVVYNVYYKNGRNATGRCSIERDFLIRSIEDIAQVEDDIKGLFEYGVVDNIIITNIQQFPI